MKRKLLSSTLKKLLPLLLLWGFYVQATGAEGYLIKKNGDTLRVTFNISTVFNTVNYSGLQREILYFSNGKSIAVDHDMVQKVYFSYKNQVFTYVPVLAQSTLPELNNQKIFLKLYSESKVNVFEYYYGFSHLGIYTNCTYEAGNGNKYIYVIHDAGKLFCFHKKFMPNVQRLFVNCPEGIREVKRQGLECLDVINVATVYCNYCKK